METENENLFAKYVEGVVPIEIETGTLQVKILARDKLELMELQKTNNMDGILQFFVKILKRTNQHVPDEQLKACVLVESEAISREISIYLKMMTRDEYEQRKAKLLGVDYKDKKK